MLDKATQRKLKNIKKEIKRLKKEYKRVEFRPCQNDMDLSRKAEDLKIILERIYELEKEQDRFILDSGRISHGI